MHYLILLKPGNSTKFELSDDLYHLYNRPDPFFLFLFSHRIILKLCLCTVGLVVLQ